MIVKLTELPDRSFKVESPRNTLGTFKDTTRGDLVRYLRDKANEIGESLRIVTEFEEREEKLDWSKVMKPRW
ncbi:MAG: hypothetical protein COZ06_04700 [Armatimonadetes bacterium CG_4_10_14_3_um_filter_66_18]|nr:hypothetical protein [Armatimonadota bacterium]OIP04241.1 MAG: hypothetical protein AUJ96_13220 [Armatimonadetes bacterium CG2_30_66_41]PIU91580.1 MAG: hypothetical protein COS65_21500 [Armatimonadetes bacterium CG06_land_8_20_14_3_00_66_21]PIX45725.1 MAG: hypothetical protein COZ57_14535 [Armatimonadetes bacterium CG_4_8_14_3_um_filter_66_20]PIY51470.1 MAG: hypothetical protein COZ06_04700 [Armatimonadetes bacterium CG_4_10_14_3_um_filter_66_18]PIZ41491.1 MAG: hypothetical protein COY42_19